MTPTTPQCFPVLARTLVFALLVFAPALCQAQRVGASLADRSIAELQQMAADGDAEAQLLVGDAYLNGTRVPKDPVEGARWIRKAADQGLAGAHYILGICYDTGQGVKRDMTQAVACYHKAAEAGIIDAQFNLGDCYLRGDGVEKNVSESMKWYELAANQGDVAATAQLGFLYLGMDGGKRDAAKAATYLRKAAYNGNRADAKWALGTLYQLGEGVAQNDEDAVRWFKESAMQGDSTGMYYLARAMTEGRGTPKDELRANEWMVKSAAKGNPKATEHLAKKAGSEKPAEAPAVAEAKPEPAAPEPSFVAATSPADENAAFTSFVSTPPGGEPQPRDTTAEPGFMTPAPKPAETDDGFTSFVADTPPSPAATDDDSRLSLESAEELAKKAVAEVEASLKLDASKEAAGESHEAVEAPAGLPPFAKSKTEAAAAPTAPEPRPASGGAPGSPAFPLAIAYMTLAMASAMVIISLMFFLTFKTRIRGLEGEIKKAQFELSKANVNLSSMMHQVEQIALQAPAEHEGDDSKGIVSLPDFEDGGSQAGAETFKISRSR